MVGEVLDAMVTLAEEGMTMICVTHEMGLCAHRGGSPPFLWDHGQIAEAGKPDTLFTAPRHPRLTVPEPDSLIPLEKTKELPWP